MAKKKVASKKRKDLTGTRSRISGQNALLKEVAGVTEELEDILNELRTSTVRYTRDRIEKVIARLKTLGETK